MAERNTAGDLLWSVWAADPEGVTGDKLLDFVDNTLFRTRKTAGLFLVLIVELLKPGGRAAVVLPDGTLFGKGVKTRLTHLYHYEPRLGGIYPEFHGFSHVTC